MFYFLVLYFLIVGQIDYKTVSPVNLSQHSEYKAIAFLITFCGKLEAGVTPSGLF